MARDDITDDDADVGDAGEDELSRSGSESDRGPGVAESGRASSNVLSDDVTSSSISTATALREDSFWNLRWNILYVVI